jgi:Mg-chelatase subunit ChlD
MELYTAARETCLRLYVANGGSPLDKWTIKPYPGTAAIAYTPGYAPGYPAKWTLCMPAFPLDVRLPRWKADLVAAYTVHELLHALWTDWNIVAESRARNVHNLVNALEDNRIEAKASKGDLVMVSEARKLLVALNDHIARRAMANVDFSFEDPAQFSFVLNLVIFAEKLGYQSALPKDWRKRIRPEWAALFDLALARFDALKSTNDCLQLALDLKALAAAAPKAKSNLPPPAVAPDAPGPQGPHEVLTPQAPAPREPEIVEDTSDSVEEPQGSPPDGVEGEGGAEPAPEGDKPLADVPEPAKGDGAEGDEVNEGNDAPDQVAGDGAQMGSRGAGPVKPEPEEESAPSADLSDATQAYEEANLDDVARDTAKEAGASKDQVSRDAMHATTILNIAPMDESFVFNGRGNAKQAGAMIESPAKLRRHLTMAVKSPERVGTERRQVSGRLDMQNLVGLASGAPNVFRRRVEEEGREAAVTILLDVSSSMEGMRLAAAKAMALHMGDALKAAGVRFEIACFDDGRLATPKPFARGWAADTQRAVASVRYLNGTAMLPAMKQCAERLLKQGNVTRRILLTLTDGQDSYSASANQALCAFYRSRGVEIVGIGLMVPGLEKTFNGAFVYVPSALDLSAMGLAALVRALDKGAPRMA